MIDAAKCAPLAVCGAALMCALASCSASGAGGERARPVVAIGGTSDPLELAQRAVANKQWTHACQLYRDSLRAHPEQEAPIYMEYAGALLAAGRGEEAHELLDQALALHPECAALYELRADNAAALGFHRCAERDYEAATRLQPSRAELWQKLGETRLALDLPAAAVTPLSRSLQYARETPERVHLLALAHAGAGDGMQAARAYAHAFEILPKGEEGAHAEWLLEGARLYAHAVIAREDPHGARLALGWTELAERADPTCAEPAYLRGQIYEALGQRDQAAVAYDLALEKNGLHLPALVNLARLCLRNGQRERADELAQRALALDPDAGLRRELRGLIASAPR